MRSVRGAPDRGAPAWCRVVLGLLWPEHCRLCGAFLDRAGERGVCQVCHERLPRLPARTLCRSCGRPHPARLDPTNDWTCPPCGRRPPACAPNRHAAPYEGPVRDLILAYKFDRCPELHFPLTDLLVEAYHRHYAANPPDWVTHVPLSWRRRWRRGFDQAELLARRLARRVDRPHRRLLARRGGGPPQSLLPANRRAANVQGAFRSRRGSLTGWDILLVDDVCTTGHTLAACAEALHRAGAARVRGLTVARAAPDH